MEHSVIIGGYDLYEKWSLIPTSRPVIAAPKIKSYTIDIPGADGKIDVSDQPSGYPVFNNRTGSLEFIVEDQKHPWTYIHDSIINTIHGREMKLYLADDPGWYYTGRFFFNAWRSEKDWSRVVIDYDLDPYKYSDTLSTAADDWLWDPFNFEEDVVIDPSQTWSNYRVDGTDVHVTTYQTVNGEFYNYVRSRKPVIPKLIVTPDANKTVAVRLKNAELSIDVTKTFSSSYSGRDADFVLSAINPKNKNDIYLTGNGTVTFQFRPGRL